MVIRGLDGADGPSPSADSVSSLLDTLVQVAQRGSSEELLETVESVFDLLDDDVRTALAVRAAAEESAGSSRDFLAVGAAVRVVTERTKEAAGDRLRKLLAVSKGDARVLRDLTLAYVRKGQVDRAFKSVLDDNIAFANAAGQEVKARVLTFLRDDVIASAENDAGGTGAPARAAGRVAAGAGDTPAAQHHAPRFAGDAVDLASGGASTDEGADATVTAPHAFLPGRGVGEAVLVSGKEAKKRGLRERVQRAAGAAAESLCARGWAVIDDVFDMNAIRAVRSEIALLGSEYRQSEIWVGRAPGVGAQVAAPSVRGDQVLWMCGGHARAAGVVDTRELKTKGAVEPCDPAAARRVGQTRFSAVRDVIRALDALVQHVSDCVPRLRGALTRRSDCMLAVYPGQGARFQRHVDNTAGDGRLLTALVYLNPGWDRAHGGALRVFDARVGDAPAPAGAFEAVDVFPEAGRVALFFADAVAHEVRPCFAHRHAMTVWYYGSAQRAAAVDAAASAGPPLPGAESEAEARAFVQRVVAGSDGAEELARAARELSEGAAGVVASVLGLPPGVDLPSWVGRVGAEGVRAARDGLSRMGLGEG